MFHSRTCRIPFGETNAALYCNFDTFFFLPEKAKIRSDVGFTNTLSPLKGKGKKDGNKSCGYLKNSSPPILSRLRRPTGKGERDSAVHYIYTRVDIGDRERGDMKSPEFLSLLYMYFLFRSTLFFSGGKLFVAEFNTGGGGEGDGIVHYPGEEEQNAKITKHQLELQI